MLTFAAPTAWAQDSDDGDEADAEGVLLFGVPGLTWSDIDESRTPAMWDLAGEGASGSMSVRTIGSWTCPEAAWVSISAGARAGGLNPRDTSCTAQSRLPEPARNNDGSWYLPWYEQLKDTNTAYNYGARLGSLADAAHENEQCVAAIGPGAALVAADPEGRIDYYSSELSDISEATDTCSVVVVDPGITVSDSYESDQTDTEVDFDDIGNDDAHATPPIPEDEEPTADDLRHQAAADVDQVLADTVAELDESWRLLLSGVSDTSYPSRLHPVMFHGKGIDNGQLSSPTTGRDGYLQIVDLAPTLLDSIDTDVPAVMSGRPVSVDTNTDLTSSDAVDIGVDEAQASAAVAKAMPHYFNTLTVIGIIAVGAATWMVLRRRRNRLGEALCVAVATFPLAALIAAIPPWWRTGHPNLTLWAIILSVVAILVAATQTPWLRRGARPAILLASLTVLLVLVDQFSGATWALHTPMGYTAQSGARFTGIGNYTFAVFAAANVLLIAFVPWDRIRIGNLSTKWITYLGPTILSLATIATVGAPSLGRNVGGTITLVASLTLTCWLVWGRRLSLSVLTMAGGLALAVITLAGFLDYLRPASSQSHLGRFIGSVVSGDAGAILERKMAAAIGTVTNTPLTAVVIAALVAAIVIVWKRGQPTRPSVHAAMIGLSIASIIGFAVNDSGVALPAFTVCVGFTLLSLASTRTPTVAAEAPVSADRPLR
ncbi:hypothetical protein [Haloglycomyces albus]|uniref:hypothetical protein n=1 Tax=Haloglycomyces albus TaxID=526067 RepID=UPI00046CAF50|nr:hypothetical protein [Haloglycomyces albus]